MKKFLYLFLLLFCISSKILSFSTDGSSSKDTIIRSFAESLRICISNTTEVARQFFLNNFMVFKKADSTGTCSDDRAAAYSKVKDSMVASRKDYAQKIIAKRPIGHVKKIIIKYFKTLPSFSEPCIDRAAREARMKEMARRVAVRRLKNGFLTQEIY